MSSNLCYRKACQGRAPHPSHNPDGTLMTKNLTTRKSYHWHHHRRHYRSTRKTYKTRSFRSSSAPPSKPTGTMTAPSQAIPSLTSAQRLEALSLLMRLRKEQDGPNVSATPFVTEDYVSVSTVDKPFSPPPTARASSVLKPIPTPRA